jgi:hypothetical protein
MVFNRKHYIFKEEEQTLKDKFIDLFFGEDAIVTGPDFLGFIKDLIENKTGLKLSFETLLNKIRGK